MPKGVYRSPSLMYKARVYVQGKHRHLGTFITAAEAARAYDTACRILGKPVSGYNNPNRSFTKSRISATILTLVATGVDLENLAYDIRQAHGIVDELSDLLATIEEDEALDL